MCPSRPPPGKRRTERGVPPSMRPSRHRHQRPTDGLLLQDVEHRECHHQLLGNSTFRIESRGHGEGIVAVGVERCPKGLRGGRACPVLLPTANGGARENMNMTTSTSRGRSSVGTTRAPRRQGDGRRIRHEPQPAESGGCHVATRDGVGEAGARVVACRESKNPAEGIL